MTKRSVFVLGLLVPSLAAAQQPGRVAWSIEADRATKRGEETITVHATIDTGWHVYALRQVSGGPTPLRVSLDAGSAFSLSGPTTSSAPQRHRDVSFGLDTEFYVDSFELRIPVRSNRKGHQDVPLSVRFQMCSDTTCMPPKTVHLVAKADA